MRTLELVGGLAARAVEHVVRLSLLIFAESVKFRHQIPCMKAEITTAMKMKTPRMAAARTIGSMS